MHARRRLSLAASLFALALFAAPPTHAQGDPGGQWDPLALAARTATVSTAAFLNTSCKGYMILVDVTALALTPSVVPQMDVRIADGTWVAMTVSGIPFTSVAEWVFMFYPHPFTSDPQVDDLQRAAIARGVWRFTLTHADTDSITYSVRASCML